MGYVLLGQTQRRRSGRCVQGHDSDYVSVHDYDHVHDYVEEGK
jgi:hypothetical protein